MVQSGQGNLVIPVADVVGVRTKGEAGRNAEGEDDKGKDGAGLLLFVVRALGEPLLEGLARADVVVLGDVAVLVDAVDAVVGLLLHVAAKAVGGGAVDAGVLHHGEGVVVEAVVVANVVLDEAGGLQVLAEIHDVLGGVVARPALALVVVATDEEAGERHRLGPVAAAVVVLPSVVVVVLLHLDAVAAAVLDVAVVDVRPVLEAADGEAVHALGGQRVGLEEGGAPLALRGGGRRTLCYVGVRRGGRGYRRQRRCKNN